MMQLAWQRWPLRAGTRSPSYIDWSLLAFGLLLPAFASDFTLFQVSEVIIVALAILGLSILIDVSGQFSLGHGAFFGLGAYAAAILMTQVQMPYFIAVPLAGSIALFAGLLLGVPALRLDGVYLAIATFVIGVAMPTVLKLSILEPWTGGVQGIFLDKPEAPLGLPLSPDQWDYLLVLAIAASFYACSRNILASRSGRALMAIRENPVAAATTGIDVRRFKVIAFGLSAAFAGTAGAMNAVLIQFVAPDAFTIQLSISFVVGLVVGGFAGLRGALLGAIFVNVVPNLTEQVSKGLSSVIFGVVLVGVICVIPVLRRFFARRQGRASEMDTEA